MKVYQNSSLDKRLDTVIKQLSWIDKNLEDRFCDGGGRLETKCDLC